jgi:antitoxin ParD1/3/4
MQETPEAGMGSSVPTRNVNLTDELDRFVAARAASGRYANASDVVRAGLRALAEREDERAAWLAYARREASDAFAGSARTDRVEQIRENDE